MTREQKKRKPTALLWICLLLAALAAALGWYAAASAQKQAVLTAGMETLREQADALQMRLDAALQEKTEAEAAAAAAQQENESLKEALTALEGEAETLRIEALPDMELLSAGTVLPADKVDMASLAHYFKSFAIVEGGAVYDRIYGRSYVENPDVGLEDLRYLKLLHYNFKHEIQVGELIVAADLAQDVLEIFQTLFENGYEIYSMYLIDDFWTGDGNDSDTASCDANNTSAFCYRLITGGGELSNHAFGRAIDINPQQNPYVSYVSGLPYWFHENANDYIDRDTGLDHVITHDDLCYRLFTEYGFGWGGDWDNVKDYQHFEKES